MTRRGLTLIELLVSMALLLTGGGALLLGMYYSVIHTEYLSQCQIAMNAAQAELERLTSLTFTTLAAGGGFAAARSGSQQDPLGSLPGGILAIQIRQPLDDQVRHPFDPNRPNEFTSAELLDLHVAVCWQHRGRQIGDVGCQDGPDADDWVASPVIVSTRVGRRDDG